MTLVTWNVHGMREKINEIRKKWSSLDKNYMESCEMTDMLRNYVHVYREKRGVIILAYRKHTKTLISWEYTDKHLSHTSN